MKVKFELEFELCFVYSPHGLPKGEWKDTIEYYFLDFLGDEEFLDFFKEKLIEVEDRIIDFIDNSIEKDEEESELREALATERFGFTVFGGIV